MPQELIIGIIAGVVSTACFSFLLLIVKPRIKVAKEICKSEKTPNFYQIKVVNKSFFPLINLSYSLHYFEDSGDGIKRVTEIKPKFTPFQYISAFHFKEFDQDYAIRIGYEGLDKYSLDNGVFEFSIIASHPFSNTVKLVKVDYRKDKLIEGRYETGKSLRVIRG